MPPSPLSYTGEVAVPFINKTFPPESTYTKFSVPTLWTDTSAGAVYSLVANEYIATVKTAEWIKLGDVGGTIEGIIVDANTPPGTSPVRPIIASGVQVITVTGGQVAAGTTTNVIRTDSLAANTLTIEIQRSTAAASTTVGDNGVSHFNSASFTVDSNGFVSLLGGGEAIDSFEPDTGTNPVVADGSGLVKVLGQATPSVSGIEVTGGTNSLNISMFSPFAGDFSFTQSASSASTPRILTVSNADTSHLTASAELLLSVGGGSSGNPQCTFVVTGGGTWSLGIDNADSDSWKLSSSSALATNPRLAITTSGALTINGSYTLPTADGTAGYQLQTNGSGTVTWQPGSGGSYSPAAIVVSPTAGKGDYTTIGAALTAGSSGQTIFIKEGTYTEDLTLKAGVNLVALTANAFNGQVVIVGKCTFTATGTVSISGIQLQTNADFCLAITGTNASNVLLTDCNIVAADHTAISFTTSNSGAGILITNCSGNIATTGIALYSSSSVGSITITNTTIGNSGNSTTASSNSAGFVSFDAGTINFPISTSSTGIVTAIGTGFYNVQPAVCITTAGTGSSNVFYNCLFISNSSSCISIGTGTTVVMAECQLQSSNTNVLTGAGTLNTGILTFVGSSAGINTTTVNKLTTYGGTIV